MHRRIFYSIFGIASLGLLLLIAVVTISSVQSIETTWEGNLASEVQYISALWKQGGRTAVEPLLTKDKRLTLIQPDGRVIYDSVKDSQSLENHLQREEVQEALQTGHGSSIRYSDTLLEVSIYYAQVGSDGTILRLALLQDSILAYYKRFWPFVGIFFLFLLFSSYIGAKKISNSILSPITQIDLTRPQLIQSPYKELNPILNTIVKQAKTIREDAENKESYRREFTSNVSHELKTPLTSISGFAELLKAGDLEKDEIIDFSSSIYDESQRLIQLVNDIIKVSELDGDTQHLQTEKLDLYDLTEDVLTHIRPLAAMKEITIHFSGDKTFVMGNAKVLYEMIYNLCDNAIKYNKIGGHIYIDLASHLGHSSISVRDTGIGISQDDLTHVFERFYRGDKSHSRLIEGTGLGLSIVKHAAEYHGAKVTIESQLGKGTSISVIF